jgi:actin-like ATPase involved in cell morphogenesis
MRAAKESCERVKRKRGIFNSWYAAIGIGASILCNRGNMIADIGGVNN